MTAGQQRSWDEDGLVIIGEFFTAPELQRLQTATDTAGDTWRSQTGLLWATNSPKIIAS